MSRRAASFAFVIGLTSATDLSHSGKPFSGKNVLLVNVNGSVRKLTMATSESMLRTLKARAVNMNERPES